MAALEKIVSQTSLILPAHNEEAAIGGLLGSIKNKGMNFLEVIVVNDGSQDSTADIASLGGAKVINFEFNQGKAIALKKGIAAAKGKYILVMDADGQDPVDEIPKLLYELDQGYDFVNGSRFLGTLEKGAISRINYFGNKFISALIRGLYQTEITDSQAGFRAFRRQIFDLIEINSKEYEVETEMLLQAIRHDLRIKEVPVVRKARMGGRSGFKRIRNGLRILFVIIKFKRERYDPRDSRRTQCECCADR